MIHTTLMLVKHDGKLLLGMKKRGFGMGRLNGAGGKLEEGETPEEAARRETYEEVGIRVGEMAKVATIVFEDLHYRGVPERNIMHVFMTEDFTGNPQETDEIAPSWYPLSALPYDRMWIDDEVWLPEVLRGRKIQAFFHFNEDNVFTDHWLEDVPEKVLARYDDAYFGFPAEKGANYPIREAARAVLIDDNGRCALMNVANRGYYKLPGGGVDKGELLREALLRETKEEAGYEAEPLCSLGKIIEKRARFNQINISYGYLCRAKKFVGNNLMEDERDDGFELTWFDSIEDAIEAAKGAVVTDADARYRAAFFKAREVAFLCEAQKAIDDGRAKK